MYNVLLLVVRLVARTLTSSPPERVEFSLAWEKSQEFHKKKLHKIKARLRITIRAFSRNLNELNLLCNNCGIVHFGEGGGEGNDADQCFPPTLAIPAKKASFSRNYQNAPKIGRKSIKNQFFHNSAPPITIPHSANCPSRSPINRIPNGAPTGRHFASNCSLNRRPRRPFKRYSKVLSATISAILIFTKMANNMSHL